MKKKIEMKMSRRRGGTSVPIESSVGRPRGAMSESSDLTRAGGPVGIGECS